jgi:hypothetical protein
MATLTPSTVIAVFDDRGHAESALLELVHAGFSHDQIGMVTPGGRITEGTTPSEKLEDDAGEGAVAGAITGGAVGALAGALVVGLVPGLGPVLAGGILAGIALGAAGGAAVGSYLGPFIALGLSEEEAKYYGEELRSGRTVVAVRAGDRAAEARTILHSHGGRTPQLACSTVAGPVS